jgi:uncharacterized protein (DUF58 family)
MPAFDRTAVESLVRRLRLGLNPRRRRHGSGNRLGAGPGASLEFHDHREYQPGDDLRHLDWNVAARSDLLVIRRFRQEVSPRVELLCDLSVSMAQAPAKAALAALLAALLARLAQAAGSRPVIWGLGVAPRRLQGLDAWHAVEWQGAAGLEGAVPQLAPGADRYLISDGLCRTGGRRVVERLGRDAGRIALLQVLDREERDPEPRGAVRLLDPEGGELDLVLDEEACAAYRTRFARQQDEWRAALSGRGAGLIVLPAEAGSGAAVRQLATAGIVEVAAA